MPRSFCLSSMHAHTLRERMHAERVCSLSFQASGALYEGMEMRVNLSFQLLSAHLEQGESVSDGGGSEQKIPSHWHHRPLIK